MCIIFVIAKLPQWRQVRNLCNISVSQSRCWLKFVFGSLIVGLPRAPEGGPGEVKLEDVGKMPGLFPGSSEGLEVYLEMTSLVVRTVDRGIFETHSHHLGGDHILHLVAHNMEILGLHWCFVVY